MKHFIRLVILFSLLAGSVRHASAEVRLAGIFADHMVLQRGQPVQIWGWANKDAKVRVEFADQTTKASTAADGTWIVTLKPLKANTEGQPLRVVSGEQTVVINDVLVGEVWHASGQSNMAMTVGAMSRELDVVKTDIAAADLPTLRFCRINEAESVKPLTNLPRLTVWCSRTNVQPGKELQEPMSRLLKASQGSRLGLIRSMSVNLLVHGCATRIRRWRGWKLPICNLKWQEPMSGEKHGLT